MSKKRNSNIEQTRDQAVNKQNSELFEKNRRLELLKELHNIFQSAHDLSSVFKSVYSFLHNYLGGSENVRVNLLLYDKEQNGLISEEYFGLSRFGKKELAQPIGHSISGRCFKESKVILVNDCTKTDLIPAEFVKSLNLKSVVSLPIIFKGSSIGVLRVDNLKEKNAFSEADVEFFSFIAEQLAIVIENARLIEEQNKALESVERVSKIYRDTISNAKGLAYSFDFEKNAYDYMAEESIEILGLPPEEVTRQKLQSVIKKHVVVDPDGPEDFDEYKKLFDEGKKKSFKVQFLITLPTGEKKWISDFALPILDEETGKMTGFQGIMEDITIQRRNELVNQVLLQLSAAIHSSGSLDELFHKIHDALSLIIETRNFYIALLDQDEKTITFPYSSDKYDPPPWEPIPMENSHSLTAELIKNPQARLLNEEYLNKRYQKEGHEYFGKMAKCWLGAALTINGKPIGAIAVQSYEDAHGYQEEDRLLLQSVAEQTAIAIERKRAEQEIKATNKELRRINSEKDKLFSIVAHDLRSPFHGIIGLTEILKEDAETLSAEEIVEFSSEIHRSAVSLHKFLENLLLWARMQRGLSTFNPKTINVFEIVENNITFHSNNAQLKNIMLENVSKKNLEVFADEETMNIILRNLISNAIKFTHRGGKIVIKSSEYDDDFVLISVKDSGVGISKNDLDNLFKVDAKVSSAGTEGESSSGLGLMICKDLIVNHGGKIWAESTPETGSTFHFTIPIAK